MGKVSERKFQLIIAGGTVVIPFIISTVIDKYKDFPLTTTLIIWLKWIWYSIFEYQLKIWQIISIIVGLILLILLFILIKSKPIQTVPGWLDYTEERFDGIMFKWNWLKEYSNSYSLTDLRVVCPCGTSLRTYGRFREFDSPNCPRCNKRTTIMKSQDDIEAIIRDNVERNLYKSK